MSEVSTTPTTEETVSSQERPSLTLQDLTLVTQIIQVGTARGAWRADELSSVGGLYDRVIAFLTAAGVSIKNNGNIDNNEPQQDPKE